MPRNHLIIDVPYLAYVTFFSHQKDDLTARQVAATLISEIRRIVDRRDCRHVLFCFDGKWPLHRRVMFEGYKAGRQKSRENTGPEELAKLDEFRVFMWSMPRLIGQVGMPAACQPGYEADDMIAAAVKQLKPCIDDQVVIVTSDEDMFQCLVDGVVIYTPTSKEKHRNRQWLKDTYGVDNDQWCMVKAIAGCSSDGIDGIAGVGNKTACKYVSGQLSATSKTFLSIEERLDECRGRLPLVRIPWPHTVLPDGWMSDSLSWSSRKADELVSRILETELETEGPSPPF